MTAGDMPQRVVAIVADALSVPAGQVTPSASLIDDLGAESIDFLDIVFRLEEAFGIELNNEDLWSGTIDRTSQQTIDESVAQLERRQPDYRWDRLPARLESADLPRLITVQTIIHHLQRRGIS